MKKRVLISLSDKTSAFDFAHELISLGYEVLSTGGTAKALSDKGLPITNVSDVTGFPECLDGRVKTLHPAIHAGILAVRDNSEHMEQLSGLGIIPIDIIAINLYPFRDVLLREGASREEIIENIDIGGPTMLRAAAKNWQDVAVIVNPADYPLVISELKQNGEITKKTKLELAYKVFEHTSAYDTLIADYFRKETGLSIFPDSLTLTYEKNQELRYGENPHQKAAFYREIGNNNNGTITAAVQLHGKELSFNNINDANGALDTIKEFDDTPCVVAVKHANPCGIGTGSSIYEAYVKAHNADPVSIFGGIIAANRVIDKETALEINKIFVEIIIAPGYTDEALTVLEKKKNVRIMCLPDISLPNRSDMIDVKKVAGGLLVQELNTELLDKELRVVTEKKPTEIQMNDLIFGMKAVKHTKSNGIVLVKDGATTGIGPGQTNRITALELAIKYAGDNAAKSVMASDAFFPFDDCVEAAAQAGIAAIIQPGGSIRDKDSIDACNKYGIPMVFTGKRHFKH
ncbi:MAG: bifunctional phosphoribosylaminoimidazolecarboxamide formyltransferase/IMP cyclohydrolase [Eubacteriales bacterium]|jgi:phosphoribosylaminoimidazolecarboxamide formyltransferase/IMP cyclohydrolase|nr:bifunctional phosphoribosylaminoimidazolecarboxamide formyltransferase/IMP cyclohydrolase [Eubacteriales bacterium]